MKSAAGKEQPTERRSNIENVTPAFLTYLKTMVMLGRPYGQGYLSRIVSGNEEYSYWKTPDPRDFETFGELATKDWDYLVLCLHLMASHELVEVHEPSCTTFVMTQKGEDFLANPYDIYEPKRSLRYSRYERFLRNRLVSFRKKRSEDTGVSLWEVLPEYTIDRLTLEKPETLETLGEVAGMAYFRVQDIGAGILSVILESEDDFEVAEKERITKLARNPNYQNAKSAFKRNANIPGVARDLGCDTDRAAYYVECLAIAGQINAKHWIEKQVDASTLYRGAEYFLKVRRPSLGEAFRTLGIDYDTLKLCRIYALYVTAEAPEAVAV